MRRREKGRSFRGRHHGVGATDVTLSGPVSPHGPDQRHPVGPRDPLRVGHQAVREPPRPITRG